MDTEDHLTTLKTEQKRVAALFQEVGIKLKAKRDEFDEVERQGMVLQSQWERLRDQLNVLNREIKRLSKGDEPPKPVVKVVESARQYKSITPVAQGQPRVSDHAVIRYLERRYDFDFERIREEMMTPMVRDAIMAGATKVKTLDGELRISGRTVTTYTN